MLDAITQNVRFAWRSLRHRPGLVAAVTLTLGLGLGANAAMFSVVDRLLLRSPQYLRDPGAVNRIYVTWQLAPQDAWRDAIVPGGAMHVYFPFRRYRDLAKWTTSFEDAAAFASNELAAGAGQAARMVRVSAVSASFFAFFDAPPVIGRYFTAPEDSAPAGAAVTVLSDAYWLSEYGGRRDVLGRHIQIGANDYTIIGVAPKDFAGVGDAKEGAEPRLRYAEAPSVFIPLAASARSIDWLTQNCDYVAAYCGSLQMIVRRRPGVSTAVASADLTTAFQRSYLAQRSDAEAQNDFLWQNDYPPIEVARPRAIAGPLIAERGPAESATARVATWVSGVVLVVLLIACANVANLLLANAQERRREVALRLALGVSFWRLAGQLLVESLLLACAGGVAALVIAQFGGAVLTSMFLPAGTGSGVLSQPRTLVFGVCTTLLIGGATGLVPALQARRTDVTDALKSGSRAGWSDRSRTRAALLFAQGAFSFLLLVGAGLFIRSMQHVHHLRLGYDVDPVLYAKMDLRGGQLDSSARRALAQRMIDVVTGAPGIIDAARTNAVPFLSSRGDSLYVPGLGDVNHLANFDWFAVSPDFFHTVGTQIILGRSFAKSDVAGAPRVMIVSEAMAKMLWPGHDAIGQRVQVDSDTLPYTTVVGIAENTRQESLSPSDSRLQFYIPLAQSWDEEAIELFIRTNGAARDYASTVRRVLQPLVPAPAYLGVTPMREIIDPQMRSWQLGRALFLAFGGLALLVAAVGLYSVISYDVVRRTHELGVRIALGARLRHVVRAVAFDSAIFAGIGMLTGGVIAFAVAPLIAPLLFAESPRDPMVYGAIIVALVAAAALAIAGPVRRAVTVDPGAALRSD